MMFNKFTYNQHLYNYSLAIENIIYAAVDEPHGNLILKFKYKLNINSQVDEPMGNIGTYLTGGAIISQVDEPHGNIVLNYKFNFNINAQVDEPRGLFDFAPTSDVLDLTKNELLYTISGADTVFGTPVPSIRGLGGKVSYNRLESYLPLRLFPLENLVIHHISGNHLNENIDMKVEINDSSSIYTASYKDSESNEFGEPVTVDFENEMKLFNETGEKYIYVKLNTAPLVEKSETVQLKSIFNNELLLNEFDKNNPVDEYSAFFLINESVYPIENIKIYSDYNEKIATEIGKEYHSNRSIQLIADSTTAPIGVTFNEYLDNTGVNLIDTLGPGDIYAVWTKHYLRDGTGSDVSPLEHINLNIEYYKDSTSPYTDSIKTLTRIYDNNLSGKLKVFYNINDTLDSTSVNTVILDGTGDLPYNFYDTSSLADGDKIYYDITYINKYGINSILNTNNYFIYYSDVSGSLTSPPLAPQNGSLLYDSSGNMMISAQYFPENETDINNRAYFWEVSFFKENDSTSNLIIYEDDITMDVTSGLSSQLENLNYVIDTSSVNLLDGTPIIYKTRTKNYSNYSESSFDYTGEYFNRTTTIPTGLTKVFYGQNYGLNSKYIINRNQEINITPNIDYIVEDNKIIIKYENLSVIKVIYRGETNSKNMFYLRSDFTIVEDDSLFIDSLESDIFEPFEVVGNILYFLVNLKRCMAIDFNNKILYVKSYTENYYIDNSKFNNEYLFKRYAETIFNIYSNTDQRFIPYMSIDSEGNMYNKFNINNEKVNLEGIV